MNQDQSIRRICVYGIGGVGGYFGGKIASVINAGGKTDYEIYFIARGTHLEAVQRDGIKVISPEKTIVGRPTQATDDFNEVPAPDLILLCVKSYDLDDVVKSIASKVSRKTVILPLLNGVDIYDRIRMNLRTGIVLPACVFVGTHIQMPGVIQQNGGDGRILFGEDPQYSGDCPDNVLKTFDEMGINYQWHANPFTAIWTKYIFIASFGLTTVYTGKNLGEIMADNIAQGTVRDIMQEIYSIATAKGIELPAEIIEESINKANNFPYDTKTSYQRDVEAKGRRHEGDLYGGTIIKAGQALNVPTPVTSSVYQKIQNRLGK